MEIKKKTFKIGRGTHRLFFESKTRDFNLQYIMGAASVDQVAVGEILKTAAKIKGKGFDAWVNAWLETAGQVERLAGESLAAGH